MLTKNQIDKVGDRLRLGDVDEEVVRKLQAYTAEFTQPYKYVEQTLREKLKLDVTGRPIKSNVSIVDKLRRQKIRLTQIQDVAGCRVLVGNVAQQDDLVATAEVMFEHVVIDDKRERPTNNYRAVHLIVKRDGKPIEVQVRTQLQHFWAELSEKLADTHGHGIKYGYGEPAILSFLEQTSHQVALIERLAMHRFALGHQRPSLVTKETLRKRKKQIAEAEKATRLEFYRLKEMLTALAGQP